MAEKLKPIIVKHNDGTKYTLEFNRQTVSKMSREGFVLSDIVDKPVLVIPQLFAGAFLMHHPYMRRERIEEVFEAQKNRMKLIEKLAALYNEPLAAMMGDDEENEEGNATWEEG